MIVAGIMSGTSADGIDVALVRILGQQQSLKLRLIAHQHFAYRKVVREYMLNAMNASAASVADLARLNVLLGQLYADAVRSTMKEERVSKVDLIGCHGQTLYHQGAPENFAGRRIATTWQSGEPAVVAAQFGVPVVSDFRPADMAVGGTGAPLVPLLDVAFYGHRKKLRVLQNLGGIGNLTIVPAGSHLGALQNVIAFDTGPGNMVIDACMQRLFGRPFDRNGEVAAKGKIIQAALSQALKHPFLHAKPPKSAGREQFGREFVAEFLRWCGKRPKADVIATATALTAASIGDALRQQLRRMKVEAPFSPGRAEYIASGGGTQNRTLVRMIEAEVKQLGLRLMMSDELGMPNQAKEAVAFALLAYQTWHRHPGNVPSATGASRPAVLGKLSYP
jgi:anhydro-N-acetylmuramic acid kinase